MDDWRNQKLPERLPFSKKRLPKRVIFSYIFDYVIILALLAFFVIVDKITPFHQPFALDNYTLHYPFAVHERVTVVMAGLIAVIFPAAVIFLYTMVIDGLFSHKTSMPGNRAGLKRLTGRYRLKDRLWELNCGLLGLMLAVCAAFSITGSLKNAIGKPRPDLISRCDPDPDKVAELAKTTYALANYTICRRSTDDYILQDGFKSFPSAHSSVSFAGLFYLSLYLSAKLHILDSKGEVWKTVLVTIPTLAAGLIAGSRIMDARHHPFDVITGSMLGLLVAWGSYRQYFPPISETWRKGRAFPVRSWGREPQAPPARVELEDDVEMFRSAPADVERGDASGFSSQAATATGDEHGGNVFRQQIHQSQRQRQREPFGLQPSDTMSSTYSQKVTGYQNQLPATNPFANQQRHDNYDYSSSEDEENYELQQRQQHPAGQAGAYNPVTGQLTSTGYYPPPGITPAPTPPPPPTDAHATTSPVHRFPTGVDIGVRSDSLHAPSPPPHAAGTTTPHAI